MGFCSLSGNILSWTRIRALLPPICLLPVSVANARGIPSAVLGPNTGPNSEANGCSGRPWFCPAGTSPRETSDVVADMPCRRCHGSEEGQG